MKLLRSVLLAVVLFGGACYAQAPVPEAKAVRGFDVGACGAGEFVGAHIEISKDAMTIFKMVPGPGRVVELPKPVVYKLAAEDKAGKHYVSGDFEILVEDIDSDGFLKGELYFKGQINSLFYGFESDGSDVKLLDNAKREYAACVEVMKSEGVTPQQQAAPVAKEDPNTSKT